MALHIRRTARASQRARWGYRAASGALGLVHRLLPGRLRAALIRVGHRVVGQLPAIAPEIVEARHRNILDVCEERSGERSAGATHPAARE